MELLRGYITMLKYSVAAVLVGGTLITAASQPAHADDLRSYPGLMCERWDGAVARVGDFGSTDNPSSSTNRSAVECPIVKNDLLGASVRYAIPYVTDMNPSDNVRCSLWSARGGSSHSTAHTYSSGRTAMVMPPDCSPAAATGAER